MLHTEWKGQIAALGDQNAEQTFGAFLGVSAN